MSLWRFFILLGCAASALVMTLGAYVSDRHLATNLAQTESTLLARQVLEFTTELIQVGTQLGKVDAEGWASEVVEQKRPETNRRIRVNAMTVPDRLKSALEGGEASEWDPKNGVLDFFKLRPGSSIRGLRVRIQNGYVGFLGTRSSISSTLLFVGSWFALTMCFFVLSLKSRWGQKNYWLKKKVSKWIGHATGVLAELSIHIRDLLANAKELVLASARSQVAVDDLFETLSNGHIQVEESLDRLEKFNTNADDSVSLAETLKNRLQNYGEEGKELSAYAEDLKNEVATLLNEISLHREQLSELKDRLRPLLEQAERAKTSFQSLKESRDAIDREISATAVSLGSQVQTFQSLKSNFVRKTG